MHSKINKVSKDISKAAKDTKALKKADVKQDKKMASMKKKGC